MLSKFICALFLAVILGNIAGNYVADKGIYITLTSSGYMQRLVYMAPLLMGIAVVVLCMYIAKVKVGRAHSKTPQYIAIYVFTIIGIMVSGFCGLYTIKHFVYVAVGVAIGLMVILMLVLVQLYNGKNIFKIHNVKAARSTGEFIAFCIYAVVVVLSALMPLGPLPVMLVGVLWFVLTAKPKN